MAIDIISYNHKDTFEVAFKSSKNSIKIISPYIEKNAIQFWIDVIKTNPNLDCMLITKFSDKDFICGASNLEVLKNLVNSGVKIIAIKNLHTKLYLFDKDIAIIGSANFTSGGFGNNVELSVKLKNNPEEIKQLHEYYDNLFQENKNYEITIEKIDKKILELEKCKKIKTLLEEIPNNSFGANIKVNTNNEFANLIGVLKFEYSAKKRAPGDKPYEANKYSDFYFTCSPHSKRPIMLSADKLLFMTILSFDDKGKETPMIIGRARTYGFCSANIANEAMQAEHRWTEHFSNYVKLYDIEVIDTNINNGISLHKLMEHTNIPYYKQQSYVELSSDTKTYINNLLEEKFIQFGKNEELFSDSRFQTS